MQVGTLFGAADVYPPRSRAAWATPIPDTPLHGTAIHAYIGVVLGVNVDIYGSPMECLEMIIFVTLTATSERTEQTGHPI